jgi:DNA repair exonuclease SbcCD ATPase subunit
MKISKETTEILKNFAAINPSLIFQAGTVQKTVSPQKTVLSLQRKGFSKRKNCRIHFDKFKNIVLIRGENRDAKLIDPRNNFEESRTSSNGTGKSSIQEIIIYALYGKTVKRPEKLGANDVVHNKIGKDAKVELIFDNYRIVRVRKEGGNDKKNSLRLWESSDDIWDKTTEITQGTMATTQEKIESIIGLSYEAFVNMCIFTDDQRACFLECDNKQKKEIVENMLSLGSYRGWFENAKILRKEIKVKIDTKAKEYNLLINSKEDAVRRLSLTKEKENTWKETKKTELQTLISNAGKFTKMLGMSDNGPAILAYQKAQEKIKEINEKLPEKEQIKIDLESKLQFAKSKEGEIKNEAVVVSDEYQDLNRKAKDLISDRSNKEKEIQKLKLNEIGTKCDKCKGEVLEENINEYVNELNVDINKINNQLKNILENSKEVQSKVEAVKQKQEKIKNFITSFNNQISTVDAEMKQLRNEMVEASRVREPKTDNEEALLQAKIEEFKKQISSKKDELLGDSPFKEILENDEQELKKSSEKVVEKDKEVKDLEVELPYYDYWITGFGDQGIRKWIVDGIVPELNNRINYWLQFLIDNRITLKFDNELNETIQRNPVDGDPYIYHAMSTGQRRRLNLSVSQSFAHIMMLSAGSIPSIIFLDEVSTNVDFSGNIGIYKMILELAQDRQVFITTHDQGLLQMLEGCEVLDLIHENGFTTIK